MIIADATDEFLSGDNKDLLILIDVCAGWSLGEHQEWSKYSNFEVAARVPLMFYIPGVTAKVTSPGHTFPFIDVLATGRDRNTVLQALRARDSPQPSEISSQLMSRLTNSRRKKRSSDTDIYGKMFSWRSVNRKLSFEGNVSSAVRWQQKRDVFLANRGWRNIFQGNVLPFYTRVNTAERQSHTGDAFLKYRLSLHVDRHSTVNQQQQQLLEYPLSTPAIAELVDIFPTLAELAGLQVPPTCPPSPFNVLFCTEGSSLVPVIHNVTQTQAAVKQDSRLAFVSRGHRFASDLSEWKKAAFSQFPRPSVEPQASSDKPHLKNIRIMGYSMRTDLYRYTEWIDFDPEHFSGNWSRLYAKELYLHQSDPNEDRNVAYLSQYADLVLSLSRKLQEGWRSALPK